MARLLLGLALLSLPGCSCASSHVASDGGGGGSDVMTIDDAPSVDVPTSLDAPLPSADAPGVSVTVEGFLAYGNCKPVVPPDAIIANWTVVVSGATGPSASFVSGELVFSSGARVPVDVDVDTFALVSGSASQSQSRVPGTAETGACSRCGEGVLLEAIYTVDGASFPVSATGNFSCAL